jgi:hypothetical protein
MARMNPAAILLGAVQVLYTGAESATTWLQGVDRAHDVAYVTHEAPARGAFAVESINLTAQTSTVQTATLEQSLVAYANLVESTGPFITRARNYAGPHVAVSRHHIAYEAAEDELLVADRTGGGARRIGARLAAAYHPIFSPDGSRIAYTGCTKRASIPPDELALCTYRLFVGPVEGPQIDVRSVADPQPPVFSPDGRFVYVASRDDDHASAPRDRGGCFYRVVTATGEATPLACLTTATAIELRESDDGRTGVLFGHTHENEIEVHVLDLPEGAERHAWTTPSGPSVALGNARILALGGAASMTFVDLETGVAQTVTRAPRTLSWVSNQWRDDHTLYAIEHDLGLARYRILEIDARATLGG